MSLPRTVLPLTTDGKVEYVVAEKARGGGVDLSSSAMTPYVQQQISMKSVCILYDFPFKRMLDGV